MKTVILTFFIGAAFAVAAPLDPKEDAQIVTYEVENKGSGNYHFIYKTSDGTYRQETGERKKLANGEEIIAVTGSYSYIDSDGKIVEIQYTADENGYRPIVVPSGTNNVQLAQTAQEYGG